ncbi:MAG: hypothetical protein ACJ72W_29600 [Actinoallomurus sp.]
MTGAEERHGWTAGGHDPLALTFGGGILADPKLRSADDPVAHPPYERVDLLIRRLFAAGLDLHGALGHIHAHVDEEAAIRLIQQAITGLDEVIKEFRRVVVDLWPPQPTEAGAVPAVERLHGLGGGP